ncbi:hypothetical protein [Marinilabilia sp.]
MAHGAKGKGHGERCVSDQCVSIQYSVFSVSVFSGGGVVEGSCDAHQFISSPAR